MKISQGRVINKMSQRLLGRNDNGRKIGKHGWRAGTSKPFLHKARQEAFLPL
jgi:hypothetical protein